MGISLIGRIFSRHDKRCYNFNLFLKRHEGCLDIFFLTLYVAMQIALILLIQRTIISLYVIILLLIISVERITLRIKNKIILREKEKDITSKISILRKIHLKERNELTKEINKIQKKLKKE